MIGACEGGGVAGIRSAQAVAAMTADIQEGVNLPDAVAHYRDRVFAHIGGKEVPRNWDLAFVTQKKPAPGENTLQLVRIDLGLDKDVAADKAVLGVNQIARICRHRASFDVVLHFELLSSGGLSAVRAAHHLPSSPWNRTRKTVKASEKLR